MAGFRILVCKFSPRTLKALLHSHLVSRTEKFFHNLDVWYRVFPPFSLEAGSIFSFPGASETSQQYFHGLMRSTVVRGGFYMPFQSGKLAWMTSSFLFSLLFLFGIIITWVSALLHSASHFPTPLSSPIFHLFGFSVLLFFFFSSALFSNSFIAFFTSLASLTRMHTYMFVYM